MDEESLPRFLSIPEIRAQLELGETPQIRLLPGERCPFLNEQGLCEMILRYGERMLCQICRDHPRFRNYWSDRVEMGLGLVCEEAGRLILSRDTPMQLITLEDDGEANELPEDEEELLELREKLLRGISAAGPEARLKEYLIYRHLPDALYDGRLEARLRFIDAAAQEILGAWHETDGSFESLVECARRFSYDVEYDDEELERRLSACDAALSGEAE